MMKNCYLELSPKSRKEDIGKINLAKNLYIKVQSSHLRLLSGLNLNTEYLTLEITHNIQNLTKEDIDKYLSALNIQRLIITLDQNNIDESLLENIDKDYLSLDLYWSDNNSLQTTLSYLLKKYSNIKHFSLYPKNNSELILSDEYMGFTRYHHNMWSQNPNLYYAYYDLRTILEKRYTGLGNKAISRDKYKFTKRNTILTYTKEYIDIQDHIDRLNYYLALDLYDLSKYSLINKEQYFKDISLYPVILVHQKLIADLFNT